MPIPPKNSTIAVDEATAEKMLAFYGDHRLENSNPYIVFVAHDDGVTVTLFARNAKGKQKATFQGISGLHEARLWDPEAKADAHFDEKSLARRPQIHKFRDQIGSDEVGTGDFFGPICVCAARVNSSELAELSSLHITDSKLMDDEYIRQIGPRLIKDFEYSQLSLPNEKFNKVWASGVNMNAIKAKMHNRCLLNLAEKNPGCVLCQDQFAPSTLYYSYLKGEEKIAQPIDFKTKGELAFPSVALASVIARYSFLCKMEDLSKHYKRRIPFGAGEEVDRFAERFAKDFGMDELRKITKGNFVNMKRLLGKKKSV